MKKFIVLILLFCLTLSLFVVNNINFNDEKIYAENFCKASVVIERDSKRVLYEHNKDDRLAMASTTKIMTALVTLDNCNDIHEKVKVDDRAIGIEGTSIYLRKGEELTVEELLYGLILPSGNDASLALAFHIGKGNLQYFVNLMNEKAESLNLKNTHFENPHGLDADGHYTSAYDLAVITSEALKNDTFREIVKTPVKQISGNSEVPHRFLRNKQRLLKTLEGCGGVKSGFTDNAGRCLVTSCCRDGMELISVVLNCPNMFDESARIINDAFIEYNYETLLSPYNYITNIKVDDGVMENVKVYSMKGFKFPLKDDEKTKIKIETEIEDVLSAPVEKEKIVGNIKVYFDEELVFSENIYTMEAVESKDIKDKVKDIIDKWFYE